MNLLNKTCKIFTLFFFGGIMYSTLERMARGHTHWTMFIVGGLCFCMIGLINEVIPWEMAFWKQCVIGGCIVTAVEFISGCIINIWLGWHVCDDYLRYWFFNEEKPVYKLF